MRCRNSGERARNEKANVSSRRCDSESNDEVLNEGLGVRGRNSGEPLLVMRRPMCRLEEVVPLASDKCAQIVCASLQAPTEHLVQRNRVKLCVSQTGWIRHAIRWSLPFSPEGWESCRAMEVSPTCTAFSTFRGSSAFRDHRSQRLTGERYDYDYTARAGSLTCNSAANAHSVV